MKRKIVIIIGSKNDLKQCLKGLELLGQRAAEKNSGVSVNVYVRSVHRHVGKLLWLLESLQEAGDVDVIIAGAGKAAHLPGCVDAFLRYHLGDTRINVIGVAFEGKDKKDNLASVLSITQVPYTQVLYAGEGKTGFKKACEAALQELPAIKRLEAPEALDLTLLQAIELANQE